MNEKHQEAITQDQAGYFTALNHIERVIAELKGLKPMLEDEAMAWKYKIANNILSPTGRCIGYVWAMPCQECDGTGLNAFDGISTDCNGNLLPTTGARPGSLGTINDMPAVPA